VISLKTGVPTQRLIRAGVWYFAVLQVLDVLTTLFILRHGGRELNPVMRAIIDCSPWDFIGVKIIFVFVAAHGLDRWYRNAKNDRQRRQVAAGLLLLLIEYTAVVASNLVGIALYLRVS